MLQYIYSIVIAGCLGIVFSNNLTIEEQKIVNDKALEEFAKIIFERSMEAKRAFQGIETRELPITNFATTAPRSEFIVHADIGEELATGVASANIFVSTDNQSTWQSAPAVPLLQEGYETTWGGTILTNDGSSSYSYLSGTVDSGVLGESFGNILVSSSPHNINGNWPPGNNLYATLANDASGDASSNFDITSIRGTYKGQEAIDADGNEYTDIERFYLSMSLSGGCCDTGSFFGPWNLYGISLVNPESDAAVAYAIGYGDGGFGQLTPGLLKITGDLATGEVGGFDYITTNISYSTSGNDMQATALMDYVTTDSDWGSWPNSYNGFIVLGVTIEASLSGLDVDADIKDQTDPGLFVCNTVFQDGNAAPVLSNPSYDDNTKTLSIDYIDSDGNLPWLKTAEIDGVALDMIPNNHTYDEGVTYSANIDGLGFSGDYTVTFTMSDGIESQVTLPINVGGGGCLIGDSNGDGLLNVLDVVLLVNLVLVADSPYDECSDINGDGTLNVLDVVLLVNIVLGNE